MNVIHKRCKLHLYFNFILNETLRLRHFERHQVRFNFQAFDNYLIFCICDNFYLLQN